MRICPNNSRFQVISEIKLRRTLWVVWVLRIDGNRAQIGLFLSRRHLLWSQYCGVDVDVGCLTTPCFIRLLQISKFVLLIFFLADGDVQAMRQERNVADVQVVLILLRSVYLGDKPPSKMSKSKQSRLEKVWRIRMTQKLVARITKHRWWPEECRITLTCAQNYLASSFHPNFVFFPE
jgi:hypothetical protein